VAVILFFIFLILFQNQTFAAPSIDRWVLTDNQRRAFLHYYSPIILKRADENNKPTYKGHDWITNFNFDMDGDFSNNRQTWENEKYKYIDKTSHQNWEIKPTLYTSVIEYMLNEKKYLTLVYHIYHAYQPGGIHDWERIEVQIDDVKENGPGKGEEINYYVLTRHNHHDVRKNGHSDLHYVENYDTEGHTSGKHLLVWQAQWNGKWPDLRKAELHYVQDGLSDFINGDAVVDISNTGEKTFHYIFIDRDSADTAAYFNATPITYQNAYKQYSGCDFRERILTSRTKRITYELQDLADILPTHWIHANGTNNNINWRNPTFNVNLLTPLETTVTGQPLFVPSGLQTFLRKSMNGSRSGYINKGWFWGTYNWNGEKNWTERWYEYNIGKVWNQHDYFSNKIITNLDLYRRKIVSQWLPDEWHKQENGGFDGRWIGLFHKYNGIDKVTLQESSEFSPALTVFQGRLYIAWTGRDDKRSLNVISSADGKQFDQKVTLPATSDGAPALAVFRDKIYISWMDRSSTHSLNLMASENGKTFGNQVTFESSNAGPAIVGHLSSLVIAWAGRDSAHSLNIMYTDDGTKFHNKKILSETTNYGPSLGKNSFGTYMAWTGKDLSQRINVAFFRAGTSDLKNKITLEVSSARRPSLVMTEKELLIAWTGERGKHRLNVIDSEKARVFNNHVVFDDTSTNGPALTMFQDKPYIAWTGTNSTGNLNVMRLH